MTRAQARHADRHSSNRGSRYKDFFCLTPRGVRVGYASPRLTRTLPARERRRTTGRVVWISTADPYYVLAGIRPGATIALAAKRFHTRRALHIGLNDWYVGRDGTAAVVMKVRHGIVEELGIADARLVRTRRATSVFMRSFG
jgi:hypothetical protein